jgi:hypothetical protein
MYIVHQFETEKEDMMETIIYNYTGYLLIMVICIVIIIIIYIDI